MPSIREIAKLAGVSTSTASRALNNDPAVRSGTRSKVLDVAVRSGYAPTMGRRVVTNIGLVFAGSETLTSTFDSNLLAGIVRGLNESRFDLVILNLQRDKAADETFSQFFMRKSVRGVLVRSTTSTRHVCEAIADERFPMVALSERFENNKSVNYIGCESLKESTRAIEYLIALGHRRVAFGMNSVPDQDHLDRLKGYQVALERHGIAFDERLVFRHAANLAGGASAMKMIMSMQEPPTAVYFADPLLSIGAINAAHEFGLNIPREISVVGFDDADVRHSVYPPMTAVCQDAAQLGFEAAVRLARLIEENSGNRVRQTLPTCFEVNRSTAPPAGAVAPTLMNGRGAPV